MSQNFWDTIDSTIFTSDYNDALLCEKEYYDPDLLPETWEGYDEYSSAIYESI